MLFGYVGGNGVNSRAGEARGGGEQHVSHEGVLVVDRNVAGEGTNPVIRFLIKRSMKLSSVREEDVPVPAGRLLVFADLLGRCGGGANARLLISVDDGEVGDDGLR